MFFKWYGGFTESIRYFYLLLCRTGIQKLLQQLGKKNVAFSGDSFDRVAAILDKDSTLDYISQFKMIL
jgi:3-deoxy-D-manno-octulosonic-acid transferase